MIGKLKELTKKKYFHAMVILTVFVILVFLLGIMVLKYHVEGETNMPFELTKISIISSSEGIDVETTDTKWAFDVYQSNDIYLYIDKNKNYDQTEAIQSVKIDNVKMDKTQKGDIKLYKPDSTDEKKIFKNVQDNIIDSIAFEGSTQSMMKQLKISNQGGLIAFRCSIDNLAHYMSNDEIINHFELLKKAGITR